MSEKMLGVAQEFDDSVMAAGVDDRLVEDFVQRARAGELQLTGEGGVLQ